MTFGEVLAHFKKMEGPEVLVALIEDALLRKALVAFPAVRTEYITPVGDCPKTAKTSNAQWDWLWSRVRLDREGIATLGTDLHSGAKVFRQLRSLRLIYPDGTINVMAQQYLRSIVAQQLNKGKGKAKGGA